MNVKWYRRKNNVRRVWERIKHPAPFYQKSGGINAVVNRADGTKEDLGRISDCYTRRWRAGTSGSESRSQKKEIRLAAEALRKAVEAVDSEDFDEESE